MTGVQTCALPISKERAAVASVILNRAKKAGGDIIGVLNAPFQFQAITGPRGTGYDTNNPWSPNAKKIIPGVEKDIAANLKDVPPGLDSFTSAIPSAYRDVGGQAKYNQKMAEMKQHSGQQIGQTMFASYGTTVPPGAPSSSSATALASAPNTGNALLDIFAGYSQQRDQLMRQSSGSSTVVNAPVTNVAQNSGGGSSSANAYNTDMMRYLLRPVT